MLSLLLSLLIGLLILLVGSSLAVGHAIRLSRLVRLSPLVIGATLMAIGTSLPELLVSVIAQIEGSQGLSLGNIIGSNIANFGIVLAVSIILSPISIGTRKTQRANIVLFFITGLFAILLYRGEFTPVFGSLFFLGSIFYLAWQIIQGEEARNHEDHWLLKQQLPKEVEQWWLTSIRLFITLAAVFFGSKLVVESSLSLAPLLGRKAAFFGLTIIAIGTSLPELSTSIIGSIRGQSKLVAGNLIGSNIINILLIGGTVSTLGAQQFVNTTALFFLGLISLVVFVLFLTHGGKKIRRLWGVFLFFIYLIYLASFALVRPT